MQGLPLQLITKKTQATGPGVQSAKGNSSAVPSDESVKSGDFSELFASLAGGEVKGEKAEKGEALKNILGGKNAKAESVDSLMSKNSKSAGKNAEEDEGEEVEIFKSTLTPKQAGAIVSALQLNEKQAAVKGQSSAKNDNVIILENGKTVEEKIAKTSNNLDQLLNSLKGTEENENEEVEENGSPRLNNGQMPAKGEKKIKSESPLEFLVKGTKNKNVGENLSSPKTQDVDGAPVSKKIMSAEDYLQNMHSADKKANAKLALVPEMEQGKLQQAQAANQKVKGYGQGLNLLSDPKIINSKDLAFKEKGPKASSDPLKAVEMKKGQELSQIKSDVLPIMNQKEEQPHLQAQTAPKVLDLSKMNTSNTNEIIKKISDYVEQNQVANSSSLDLSVKHESLGEFKIQVSKMPNNVQGSNLVDMQITTSSKEGHDFFVKNEVGLMKNLNQAGINLSDLRIVSSMSESTSFGQTDSRQSSSFHQGQDGSKQYSSFESSSFSTDGGSQRRKELWEEYQQRYGA